MKALFFICSLVSLNAMAETKTPVSLSKVNFDGETLQGSYVTGGGCQDHSALVELDVIQSSESMPFINAKVYDVTAEPDYCEALLGVEVKVNLKEMVTAKAEELGISTWGLTINLPVVIR